MHKQVQIAVIMSPIYGIHSYEPPFVGVLLMVP